MQLNTQYQSLPQMNAESNKRDKALEKIATAVELKLEDSAIAYNRFYDAKRYWHVYPRADEYK